MSWRTCARSIEIDLMQRIKHAFDPAGIMNPGQGAEGAILERRSFDVLEPAGPELRQAEQRVGADTAAATAGKDEFAGGDIDIVFDDRTARQNRTRSLSSAFSGSCRSFDIQHAVDVGILQIDIGAFDISEGMLKVVWMTCSSALSAKRS